MRPERIWLAALTVLFSLSASVTAASHPTHEGKVLLFGNLHAHSKLSDDVNNATDDFLPLNAFRYAHQHGLDFLAISDHHKAVDSNHRLFMTENEYETLLYDVARSYTATNTGGFIAIAAIEWGNTATGNHVNAFGMSHLPPDSILDAAYDQFFAWATTNAEFVQFNHPNSWQGESHHNLAVGNFGQSLYPDTRSFATKAGAVTKTVAVLNSVRGGHITGALRHSTDKTHREIQMENYYRQFLNMGFHLSPAADQDTHWTNWGTVTAARTAVWADGANYPDVMKAFKANRVYATEDDEMAVAFQASYGGKTYWMGETVPLDAEEADVELRVKVWQATGSDGDPVNEGPYTITLVIDPDGQGGVEASRLPAISHVPQGVVTNLPLHVMAGQYVYVQVTEEGGKDNPVGDGTDEVINATGAPGSDGKRDDMNDSAITSPIWFMAQPALFVWSVNSAKYHDANCWVVPSIGASNKRSGNAPPPGKTKHNCHP